MTGVAEIVGAVLIAAGAFFFVVGALGIYRMPDVFTRMHASGISDTVGAGLLLLGMMFLAGFTLVAAKLAIILGIILFTSPIATHALAQATLHAGVEPMLSDRKVMRGPGARPEPARAKRVVKKATSPARRKRPVADAARKTRRSGSKGRSRS